MNNNKIIIYQVLTRLYGNRCEARLPNGTIAENGSAKMNDYTASRLKEWREQLGVTHVWYTGILRHATMTDYSAYGIPRQHPAVVKGRAGSPYAVADYYDVDPDLAVNVPKRMEEFLRLVNRTHRAGLKVVIDFVPNHVARQYQSVAKPEGVRDIGEDDDPNVGFDPAHNNFYYCPGQTFTPYFDLYHGEKEPYTECPAKATGNDCFHNAPGQNDWYETVKLNYGVDYYAGGIGHFDPLPDTWLKMRDVLLYWSAKGVDGFRCDMAEMVPPEFWAWVTAEVRSRFPEVIFIGEVYRPSLYRHYVASGFDYLYDKVGMYDTLCDVLQHRRPTECITQAWQQTDDIRQHMLYFLENHDELRLASDFLVGNGRKALPALVVGTLLQSGPFMLYAGQEWGERGMDAEGFSGISGRTTIFDYWTLAPQHNDLYDLYSRVLGIARQERAVGKGLMFDLMYVNTHLREQYAFLRKAGRELLLVVANFTDTPVEPDICLPAHAFDYLDIAEGEHEAVDLLSGQPLKASLRRNQDVRVVLEAHGAIVLKFIL